MNRNYSFYTKNHCTSEHIVWTIISIQDTFIFDSSKSPLTSIPSHRDGPTLEPIFMGEDPVACTGINP
jgi:hypothetical protein